MVRDCMLFDQLRVLCPLWKFKLAGFVVRLPTGTSGVAPLIFRVRVSDPLV